MQTKNNTIALKKFNIPAILAGLQTQLRIALNPQPPDMWGGKSERFALATHCPYGMPGELLRVRSTRITLRVLRVWIERVQDISDADVWAEGIEELDGIIDTVKLCEYAKRLGECATDGRVWFAVHWDATNAAHGFLWDDNPWVLCMEFERAWGVR